MSENAVIMAKDLETVKNEILQNLATAFAEPELYPGSQRLIFLAWILTALQFLLFYDPK